MGLVHCMMKKMVIGVSEMVIGVVVAVVAVVESRRKTRREKASR